MSNFEINRLVVFPTEVSNIMHSFQYRNLSVGTSDCNDYIPVYAVCRHIYLEFPTGERVLEYTQPSPQNRLPIYDFCRTYRDLFAKLKHTPGPYKYLYKIQGEENYIGIDKGLLYDEDTVLMCLALKTSVVLDSGLTLQELNTKLKPEDFVLIISTSFEEERYKNIYKKVDLEYISAAKSLGIDIVHTNNISRWVFKNNYTPPKFKTVTSMKKHLERLPEVLIQEINLSL